MEDKSAEEINKAFDDYEVYQQLCEYLWIPSERRGAVFGNPIFYNRLKEILSNDAFQLRISNLLKMAKLIPDQKGNCH